MKFIDDAIKESEQRASQKDSKKLSTLVDEELLIDIEAVKPKIYVIGTGGAGNNTISRLTDKGISDVKTITINTDAQDLYYAKSDEKLLVGKQTCRGLGTGGKPEKGEISAEENMEEIRDEIADADMVFITCGLGGGTGSGSAPVIAKIAKKLGALTVIVASMPFNSEGPKRRENADNALTKLQENADSVIIVPNEKILDLAPNLSIRSAFMLADEILGKSVKGITDLIMQPADINLDFEDVKTVMEGSGICMIGMGESDSGDRALESVFEAINSKLLDLDLSRADRAIVNIFASDELTMDEANKMVSFVSDSLANNANVIWGLKIDEELQHTVRTTVIIAGVRPFEIESFEENSNSIPISEETPTPEDTTSEILTDDDFFDDIF
ncbi:MAG: cell division protein FtsZ [Methanobrevibacter sp.]|jgi:cell division protein FtsZ|nr:cell division protein FtsZ [Candidatus Methanoflexus mossambicus]